MNIWRGCPLRAECIFWVSKVRFLDQLYYASALPYSIWPKNLQHQTGIAKYSHTKKQIVLNVFLLISLLFWLQVGV